MVLLSLFGIFWVCFFKKRGKSINFFYIMFFWLVLMINACFKGLRFVPLASVPTGFFLGCSVSVIWAKLNKISFKLNLKYLICLVSYVCLCGFIIIKLLFSGFISSSMVPIMNDRWQKALVFIKNNSSADAVINSWWDYGNFFKAIAKRKVIFDGQTQNNSNAYWMAKVLLSDEEEKAVKILRMLNNASYSVFPLLNKYVADPFKCFVIMEKLLEVDEEESRIILAEENVPENIIEVIANNFYSMPPPAFFIVDKTMIGKMSNISFLGNWDFIKLYIYRNIREPEVDILEHVSDIFGLSSEELRRYYKNVAAEIREGASCEIFSARYRFHTLPEVGKKEGNMLHFNNGIIFNFDSRQAFVYSLGEKRYEKPSEVILTGFSGKEEIVLSNEQTSENGIPWLFKSDEKDIYKSVFVDKPLVKSLFSKLYFFKGRGLKYFEPFYADDNAGIYIYRIVWGRNKE